MAGDTVLQRKIVYQAMRKPSLPDFSRLFGTRNIAGNGQTSLLIFPLMMLALVSMRRSWLVSGLWLGLALSKYSLSLPVFIFFIIKKQYRAALTALLVQALAVLLLAALTHTSPLAIPFEYWQILRVHTSLPGIHLASLFTGSPTAGFLAAIAVTAAALRLSCLVPASQRRDPGKHWLEQFSDNHLLSVLLLWTLLVAYHRAYDSFIAIVFFAMMVYGLSRENVGSSQAGRERRLLFFLFWRISPQPAARGIPSRQCPSKRILATLAGFPGWIAHAHIAGAACSHPLAALPNQLSRRE